MDQMRVFFTGLREDKTGFVKILLIKSLLVVAIVLSLAGLGVVLSNQVTQMNAIQAEVINKQTVIAQFKELEKLYREQSLVMARPSKVQDIEFLQGQVVRIVSGFGLDLISLNVSGDGGGAKTPQDQANASPNATAMNGVEFDLSFKGNWNKTVEFVESFDSRKDCLTAIRGIKMEPEKDGGVKTTLKYKLYFE